MRGRVSLKQRLMQNQSPKLEESFVSVVFLKVAEPLCSQSQSVNAPSPHACDPDMFGRLWSKTLTRWPAVMRSVSVIIKRFLCSSVGAISPQDAVTAERDVMENYHLHRPRALECSLAGSPMSPQEEREGKQKHKLRVNEVLEGGGERGGVNYLFESQLHFVSEE